MYIHKKTFLRTNDLKNILKRLFQDVKGASASSGIRKDASFYFVTFLTDEIFSVYFLKHSIKILNSSFFHF